MAGISVAWLLDGTHDVVLIEARESVGGNVQSVDVDVDGRPWVVDVGAQYFHPGPYPTYVALLRHLGVYPPDLGQSHAFPASITFWNPPRLRPGFVSPVLPDRLWPVLARWNRAGLQAFTTAFRAAKERDDADAPWDTTLEDWLPTLGLSREQWEGMILPWAASLYSGDVEEARGLSARAAMVFAARALPDRLTENLDYYVFDRGMNVPLQRMLDALGTTEVLTGARVAHVLRKLPGGFVIRGADGRSREVDDLVLASSGPASRRLLRAIPGTAAQRAALGGIDFRDARLMLHTDPVYAPAGLFRSFLNCAARGGYCEASMWMKPVLATPDGPGPDLWKS